MDNSCGHHLFKIIELHLKNRGRLLLQRLIRRKSQENMAKTRKEEKNNNATIELPHSGKMMTNNFQAVTRKEGSHGTPPHNLVNLSINLHNGRPDRPLGRARASLFIVHQKAHFSKFLELQSDGQ